MSAKKDRAREKLTALCRESDRDEVKAVRSRHRKFAFMPKANDAGVTYRELAEISGLSEIRVAQILRAEREKAAAQNGSPRRGRQ